MHRSAISSRLFGFVALGVTLLVACSDDAKPATPSGSSSAAGTSATGTSGSGGSSAATGSGSTSTSGTAGSTSNTAGTSSATSSATSAGSTGAGGAAGASVTTGGGTAGDATGTGGSAGGTTGTGGAKADAGGTGGSGTSDAGPIGDGGWGGVPGVEDLSTVKRTAGCGTAPTQALGSWVRFMMTVPPPGPNRGTGNRVYFINLPANYDSMKPYRIIFVVPGCGGTGDRMWDFTAAAGTEGVIQIGLNPDPGSSPYAGCFDDQRVDSVDYKFVEMLLDATSKTLCYDQHRVFFTGHSSGSWVSNMMGCVYGSKTVRAIAPSSGGLPMAPCSMLPTPGIWSHNEDDTGNRIIGSQNAINRALKVNKCGTGDFTTSPRVPYLNIANCEKFSQCPPEFPIVFCHPPTGGHLGNLAPQPARTWEFFKSLP